MIALLTTITLATVAAVTTTAQLRHCKSCHHNSLPSSASSSLCRSNSTHLVWRLQQHSNSSCHWQTVDEAKRDAYNYLRQNVMDFDLPFLQTLGFHDGNSTDDINIDGLADGLIGPAIDLAVESKVRFAYADALPQHIWREYVLNYANLNEGRNNIRRLLWDRLIVPLFLSNATNDANAIANENDDDNEHRSIGQTFKVLNTHMWTMLAGASGSDCIVFRAGQTPAIFDSMSVLSFGYASCTGLSILLVQALRAAGVPARVAGTAAWNGKISKGNHNWVEVWTEDGGRTSQAERSFANECDFENDSCCDRDCEHCDCGGWSIADAIDGNPCDQWFCHPDRMAGTEIYAARLEQHYDSGNLNAENSTHFPLAWDWENRSVPADNRTTYYQSICSLCGSLDTSATSSSTN